MSFCRQEISKFMPEIHLEKTSGLCKPGYTYSAGGPFTKNKEGKRKIKLN